MLISFLTDPGGGGGGGVLYAFVFYAVIRVQRAIYRYKLPPTAYFD